MYNHNCWLYNSTRILNILNLSKVFSIVFIKFEGNYDFEFQLRVMN